MAAASAAAILASCSVDSQSVIVTNDTELSRENETVELCFKALQNADKSLTAENVVVYDVTGSKVYVQSRSEQSLDLSHLNVGTYILTAQSKGETLKTKVMIKY